jgi:hypothetical protein
MGKQKNLKKRHRAKLRERKRTLRARYLAVRDGRTPVEGKEAELKRLANLLERRGWMAPEAEDKPSGS